MYYEKIDYDIIAQSWKILREHITLPYVIHIVGTNGKGSTGRYLASLLLQQKQNVLHYSSPHILEFNERIWINGSDVSTSVLEDTHKKLLALLPLCLIEELTYFEYTTLLGIYLSSKRDYLLLEAGLGGEFDATNVVTNDLSIFTTIGLDHQSFLGDSVEEIAETKMRSCDTQFILSPQIFERVEEVKNRVLCGKKELRKKEFPLSKDLVDLPFYLQNNLQVVLNVMEYLGFKNFEYTLPHLSGRFEKIAPNITIDVGHNPLAAQAIAHELERKNQKITLIYNSFKDKDFTTVLTILKPSIKEVQIIQCEDKRVVEKVILEKTLENLGLKLRDFDIINLRSEENYFVFGSFLVVENFLKGYRSHEER